VPDGNNFVAIIAAAADSISQMILVIISSWQFYLEAGGKVLLDAGKNANFMP
jgi:hypothetical protein